MLADVEERFLEMVGDYGCEGNAGGWDSCDSVEVFSSDVGCYEVDVKVTDFLKSVRETWDNSKVDVVGAHLSACEFEGSEFQGTYFR